MIPYRRWGPYTIPTEAQRIAYHQRYEFSPVGLYATHGSFVPQPLPEPVSSGNPGKRVSPGPSRTYPAHSSPTVSSSTPRPSSHSQISPPPTGDSKACLICGDRATGLHYGIVSCEGCKGFFKRSVCNRRVYKCMKDKNCMMSRHKRNRCQYCRLLKCLQVGMNRKAIREDGMPGGRNKCTGPVNLTFEEIERIMSGEEYIMQKQAEQMRSTGVKSPTSDGGSPRSMSSSSGEHVFECSPNSTVHGSPIKTFLDPLSMTKHNGDIKVEYAPDSTPSNRSPTSIYLDPLSNGNLHTSDVKVDVATESDGMSSVASTSPTKPEDRTGVEYHQSHNGGSGEMTLLPEVETLLAAEPELEVMTSLRCELPSDREISYSELFGFLCKLMDRVLYREIDWVKRLSFAPTLSVKSTTGMLTDTWLDAVLLAALRGHPRELYDGLARVLGNYNPKEEEVRKFGRAGLEIMDMARTLAMRYQRLNVSLHEHVCLKVVNYLNPDVKSMTDRETVEALRKQYYLVLHDHVQLNNNNEAQDRFRELLSLLPNIKVLSGKVGDMTFECAPLMFKAMMHACGPQQALP